MSLKHRLLHLLRRNAADKALDDESRFHIECQTQANIEAGMPPAEARRAAVLEFGPVEGLKEECRSARGVDWLDQLGQDLRYAFRNFRHRPAFTLTAVAVTALGIGSAAAVFGVVDRVLFRGQPYSRPETIVSVGMAFPIFEYDFLTSTSYRELKRDHPPFESVTSWSGVVPCDLTEFNPVRMQCARVESTFLPFLGVQPALGRNFTAAEDLPGVPRVALLSHSFWKSRFGGQPAAIGRTISLDSMAFTIIGVLPESFELPSLDKADVVFPQALPANDTPRTTRAIRVFARLKPGVTAAQAVPMLAPFYDYIFRTEAPPQYRNEAKLRVRPLREFQSGDVHTPSWALLAAVLLMLLIACANVTSLLLARTLARGRDLAVRAALGASRARLIRQSLTEALLLALCGAAAGYLLARLLLSLFVLLAPPGVPHLSSAAIDLRVLIFLLAGALACGLAFGLTSALVTPRPAWLTGHRIAGDRSLRARHFFLAAQVALSLVLLSSSALLLESLWNQRTLHLGLSSDRAVTAEITLSLRYRTPAERQAFFDTLESRLRSMPGIRSVAHSDSLPPGGISRNQPYFALQAEGRPATPRGTGGIVVWRAVSSSYFDALRIPILRGRAFAAEDARPEVRSIILSEMLAKRLFPGQDPLGKRMKRFFDADWHTVVGIARDVRNGGLADSTSPEYYVPRRIAPDSFFRTANFILRGDAPASVMQSWLRAEVAALDRTIPLSPRTLDEWIGELAARPRFHALLLTLFAALGLLLAAIGLYGLMSFLVAQRTSELGVRLALGATPANVTRMLLAQALRFTLPGLLAGLLGATAAARALRTLLFHVSPLAPAPFLSAAALLLLAVLLAAFLPARRAARLDPVVTLRQD